MPKIVPLTATTAAEALETIRKIRQNGDVPLVLDDRWPAAHREAILEAANSAPLPAETAWAAATSGSSGSPRIVLRTEKSWAASFATVNAYLGAESGDSVILPAPPSSSLTLFSIAHALDGGPIPGGLATSFHGTPQAFRALLDAGYPQALKRALIGGSHLDQSLRDQAAAANIKVTSYYGAAELSFVAVDEGHGLRPFPGVEIDIRDSEIWVRSPFIALGYLGNDGPLRRDGEWATVGDRGEIIDGRLRLLGRADDAILSASATIVPEEVEAVLRQGSGIRDVMVFAWPTGNIGALVAAFIEGDAPDLAELKRISHELLAPAHRPRRWFIGTLPRTASGKPARQLAAQQAINGDVERLDV